MPVMVSRCEIHFCIATINSQYLIHQADAFNKCLPIKSRRQAHARYDVPNGYAHLCLLLMLAANGFIRRGSLFLQSFVKPPQDRANFWIEITQSLDQLYGKRPLQRLLIEAIQSFLRGDQGSPPCSKQAVGDGVSLRA